MKENKDYVVLLHGFLRTAKSFKKLENILREKGYIVINSNYPSRKDTIEEISTKYLANELREKCTDKSKKIHFVTHSMGGIVLRYFLTQNKLDQLGEIVMLAPPNRGSNLADFLSKFTILRKILGPALIQMTSNKQSLSNTLPQPKYDISIIAGQRDGKVTVDQTKLDKMKNFMIVPCVHTFIMNDENVIKAICKLLEPMR
jgi:triacylglycerol esterase/lipase EstA (alpha/beta hydrolase family)